MGGTSYPIELCQAFATEPAFLQADERTKEAIQQIALVFGQKAMGQINSQFGDPVQVDLGKWRVDTTVDTAKITDDIRAAVERAAALDDFCNTASTQFGTAISNVIRTVKAILNPERNESSESFTPEQEQQAIDRWNSAMESAAFAAGSVESLREKTQVFKNTIAKIHWNKLGESGSMGAHSAMIVPSSNAVGGIQTTKVGPSTYTRLFDANFSEQWKTACAGGAVASMIGCKEDKEKADLWYASTTEALVVDALIIRKAVLDEFDLSDNAEILNTTVLASDKTNANKLLQTAQVVGSFVNGIETFDAQKLQTIINIDARISIEEPQSPHECYERMRCLVFSMAQTHGNHSSEHVPAGGHFPETIKTKPYLEEYANAWWQEISANADVPTENNSEDSSTPPTTPVDPERNESSEFLTFEEAKNLWTRNTDEFLKRCADYRQRNDALANHKNMFWSIIHPDGNILAQESGSASAGSYAYVSPERVKTNNRDGIATVDLVHIKRVTINPHHITAQWAGIVGTFNTILLEQYKDEELQRSATAVLNRIDNAKQRTNFYASMQGVYYDVTETMTILSKISMEEQATLGDSFDNPKAVALQTQNNKQVVLQACKQVDEKVSIDKPKSQQECMERIRIYCFMLAKSTKSTWDDNQLTSEGVTEEEMIELMSQETYEAQLDIAQLWWQELQVSNNTSGDATEEGDDNAPSPDPSDPDSPEATESAEFFTPEETMRTWDDGIGLALMSMHRKGKDIGDMAAIFKKAEWGIGDPNNEPHTSTSMGIGSAASTWTAVSNTPATNNKNYRFVVQDPSWHSMQYLTTTRTKTNRGEYMLIQPHKINKDWAGVEGIQNLSEWAQQATDPTLRHACIQFAQSRANNEEVQQYREMVTQSTNAALGALHDRLGTTEAGFDQLSCDLPTLIECIKNNKTKALKYVRDADVILSNEDVASEYECNIRTKQILFAIAQASIMKQNGGNQPTENEYSVMGNVANHFSEIAQMWWQQITANTDSPAHGGGSDNPPPNDPPPAEPTPPTLPEPVEVVDEGPTPKERAIEYMTIALMELRSFRPAAGKKAYGSVRKDVVQDIEKPKTGLLVLQTAKIIDEELDNRTDAQKELGADVSDVTRTVMQRIQNEVFTDTAIAQLSPQQLENSLLGCSIALRRLAHEVQVVDTHEFDTDCNAFLEPFMYTFLRDIVRNNDALTATRERIIEAVKTGDGNAWSDEKDDKNYPEKKAVLEPINSLFMMHEKLEAEQSELQSMIAMLGDSHLPASVPDQDAYKECIHILRSPGLTYCTLQDEGKPYYAFQIHPTGKKVSLQVLENKDKIGLNLALNDWAHPTHLGEIEHGIAFDENGGSLGSAGVFRYSPMQNYTNAQVAGPQKIEIMKRLSTLHDHALNAALLHCPYLVQHPEILSQVVMVQDGNQLHLLYNETIESDVCQHTVHHPNNPSVTSNIVAKIIDTQRQSDIVWKSISIDTRELQRELFSKEEIGGAFLSEQNEPTGTSVRTGGRTGRMEEPKLLPRMQALAGVLMHEHIPATYTQDRRDDTDTNEVASDEREFNVNEILEILENEPNRYIVVTLTDLGMQFILTNSPGNLSYVIHNNNERESYTNISVQKLIDDFGATSIKFSSPQQWLSALQTLIAEQKRSPKTVHSFNSPLLQRPEQAERLDSSTTPPLFTEQGKIVVRQNIEMVAEKAGKADEPWKLRVVDFTNMRSGKDLWTIGGIKSGGAWLNRMNRAIHGFKKDEGATLEHEGTSKIIRIDHFRTVLLNQLLNELYPEEYRKYALKPREQYIAKQVERKQRDADAVEADEE